VAGGVASEAKSAPPEVAEYREEVVGAMLGVPRCRMRDERRRLPSADWDMRAMCVCLTAHGVAMVARRLGISLPENEATPGAFSLNKVLRAARMPAERAQYLATFKGRFWPATVTKRVAHPQMVEVALDDGLGTVMMRVERAADWNVGDYCVAREMTGTGLWVCHELLGRIRG
jgi:hypothetical protein